MKEIYKFRHFDPGLLNQHHRTTPIRFSKLVATYFVDQQTITFLREIVSTINEHMLTPRSTRYSNFSLKVNLKQDKDGNYLPVVSVSLANKNTR